MVPIIHKSQSFGSRGLRLVEERALSEHASLITGTSYPGILFIGENEKKEKTNIKAASSISWIEKSQKLKELGRLIRG